MTQHAPPTPPEMKDLRADSVEDLGCAACWWEQHSFSCGVDSTVTIVLFGSSAVVDIVFCRKCFSMKVLTAMCDEWHK